jgi:SNF2 family DNA or RNA helicase
MTFNNEVDFLNKLEPWDLLVADEGHKAKNVDTQFRKALKIIKIQRQKIILTGTPV